jgi:hypothetical protein
MHVKYIKLFPTLICLKSAAVLRKEKKKIWQCLGKYGGGGGTWIKLAQDRNLSVMNLNILFKSDK